jgi:hypothetical protein
MTMICYDPSDMAKTTTVDLPVPAGREPVSLQFRNGTYGKDEIYAMRADGTNYPRSGATVREVADSFGPDVRWRVVRLPNGLYLWVAAV